MKLLLPGEMLPAEQQRDTVFQGRLEVLWAQWPPLAGWKEHVGEAHGTRSLTVLSVASRVNGDFE